MLMLGFVLSHSDSVRGAEFEPWCTSTSDHGWPRFDSAAELAADAPWSAYFTAVYGVLPATSDYPVCTFDFRVLNATAYTAAGLEVSRPIVTNTSELKEGDLFRSFAGPGYGIAHEVWSPLPNNTWTEVAHLVYPTELDGFWVWRTRGSGVWANVGRTIVFPTPADPSKIHADAIVFLVQGCSKQPSASWPQMESDIFGFCAREKGFDSVQFRPQDGEHPTGTFGLPGATEIVFTRLDGDENCGSADARDTLLRSGWLASSTCACANLPIDPLCGLMAFPPSSLKPSMVHPKRGAAQAQNESVACQGYHCTPTTCAV
jgi:hypothetical protein